MLHVSQGEILKLHCSRFFGCQREIIPCLDCESANFYWVGEIQGLNMLKNTQLYKEIHEQPQVLKEVLENEQAKIARLSAEIKSKDIGTVFIAARGTSDNAGRYAQYLLGAVNRILVGLATPSLFTIYKKPPKFGNTLVIGISQSGRSPDIVAVLAEARKQGALTAAITNEIESDLARIADHVIDLRAGLERSVAATKTYTSQLAVIAALSTSLAGDAQMEKDLQRIPRVVMDTLAMDNKIAEIVQRYRYMRECVVIGRGYNYATAFETALKLKELTYTIVESYSSADFMHGPLAVLEHGFPVIVIAPSGEMEKELQRFIETLDQRKAEVIVISDNQEMLENAHMPLRLPVSVPEWLSPISAIVPGQLFAMRLAAVRNYDPDKPRGIKKVTKTI